MKGFKLCLLVIFLMFFCVSYLYALNLDNNGHDWKQAKYEEKIEIGKELGKDDGSHYSFWVTMLDDFYNAANDKDLVLSIRKVSQTKVHDFLAKSASRALQQMDKQRTRDIFGLFLFIPALYLIPMFIIALPIILLGRKRMEWLKYEYPLLLIPFLVYFLTPAMNSKSFSNLIEFIFCGLVAGFIPLPRLFIRPETSRGKITVTSITTIVASVIVVLIKLFTPFMME